MSTLIIPRTRRLRTELSRGSLAIIVGTTLCAGLAYLGWPTTHPGTEPDLKLPVHRTAALPTRPHGVIADTDDSARGYAIDATSRFASVRAAYQRLAIDPESARGEIDALLIQLQTLLESADAATMARSLSSGELASPFGLAVLEAWLTRDARAASEWIAARPDHSDAHAWLVAHRLTRDPRLLATFCETLGTDAWSEALLDYAGRDVLATNPVAAISFAQSLSAGERQARLLDAIATDWALRDGPAARAWIGGITDPELRVRLASIGASSYASVDPLAAMEWLLAQTVPTRLPEAAVKTIGGIWQKISPGTIDGSSSAARVTEAATILAPSD